MKVTATGTGESDVLDLPAGSDFVLSFQCSANYSLDLQVGPEWADAYDGNDNKVTITQAGKQHVRVTGGQRYRMDVDTYNSDIVMTARQA